MRNSGHKKIRGKAFRVVMTSDRLIKQERVQDIEGLMTWKGVESVKYWSLEKTKKHR